MFGDLKKNNSWCISMNLKHIRIDFLWMSFSADSHTTPADDSNDLNIFVIFNPGTKIHQCHDQNLSIFNTNLPSDTVPFQSQFRCEAHRKLHVSPTAGVIGLQPASGSQQSLPPDKPECREPSVLPPTVLPGKHPEPDLISKDILFRYCFPPRLWLSVSL